jgi:hypothetical protein
MGNCNNVIFEDDFPEEGKICEFEDNLKFIDSFFELNAKLTADSLLNDEDYIRPDSLLNIVTYNNTNQDTIAPAESTPTPKPEPAQADQTIKEEERKTVSHERKFRASIKRTRSVDLMTPKQELAKKNSKNEKLKQKDKILELLRSGLDFFSTDHNRKANKICSLKTRLLCFVLCPSTNISVTNTLTINDKALFLFEQGRTGENEVIYKNNIHFETLLEFMVILSCEIIPFCYLTTKTESLSEEESYLSTLHRFRDEIVKKLRDIIFDDKQNITESDLVRFFEIDNKVI